MCCSCREDQLTGWLLEPRGPHVQATERYRGGGGREALRRKKKHQKAKRRRIHLSSPLLDELSHLPFHILPLSGSFTISPPSSLAPAAVLPPRRSTFTPMEVHGVVRSMTTNTPSAILAEAWRAMGGHGRAPAARFFDDWPCHVWLINSGVKGWIINLKQGANDQTPDMYKALTL